MTVTHLFKISSTDITDYVILSSLTVTDDLTEDNGSLTLRKDVISFLGSLDINDRFEYWRGETSATKRLFYGFVSNVVTGVDTIDIEVKGELSKLDRQEVNQTWEINTDPEAGVISEIAKTIIEDGGLTADVTDSGTLNTISDFRAMREPRSTKLRELKNLLNWQCYFDHENASVKFCPRSNESTGVTVTVGEYPVLNSPLWEKDDSMLFNQFTVEGAEVKVSKTEWFSGDGSTRTFTLSETPVQINNVWSGTSDFTTNRPTDSDLKIGGAKDVTENIDYTWRDGSNEITFESGSTPASGTNNIQIEYTYSEQVPGFFEDETSWSKYGKRHKTVSMLYTVTIEDVERIGTALIEEFKNPKLYTTLQLGYDWTQFSGTQNIDVNKTITIIDDQNPVNRTVTLPIHKITYNYPTPYDEIEIGDVKYDINAFLERTVDRIKKLEDRFKNAAPLRQFKFNDASIEFYGIGELWKAQKESGVLYWDDLDQGTWGNDAGTTGYNWGDDTEETATLIRRVHAPNLKYYEDFRDDYLTDTANTTATVDTTNHKITFTSGQVWMSEVIFLDNTAYENIYWSLQDVQTTNLSNLTFYASADGKTNWEEITLDEIHTFTNTSTDGIYLKIVASGSAELEFNQSDINKPAPWLVQANKGV